MIDRMRRLVAGARRRASRTAARVVTPVLQPRFDAANAAWRRAVIESARDITEASARPLLVIAPHPDDETIGAAVTIARARRAGVPVSVVVASDGGNSHVTAQLSEAQLGALRRDETRAAMRLLGVDDARVRFLGLDSAALRSRAGQARLVAELAAAIVREAPRTVLTVSRHDWHDEHRIVNRGTLEAARRTGYAGVMREYPVWHWDNGPSTAAPFGAVARRALDLARRERLIARTPRAETVRVGDDAELKRRAFATYRTQTTNFTGEPTWVPFPEGWIEKFVDREVFFLPPER